jgi:DNA-binding NtrC family response regulator
VTLLLPSTPFAAPDSDLALVAEGELMREVLRALHEVAPTPTTVLLLGERGTGRARLARLVHARSGRAGPCREIPCDSPARLAAWLRGDPLSAATDGTVILREVAALSAAAQAQLVRALQVRDAEGGRLDRIVAIAGPDLPARVAAGSFRSDLYYRLNVFAVAIPPLRDRSEDLALLAGSLLAEAALALGRPAPTLAVGALSALRARPLPGNVPELAGLLRRALQQAPGAVLEAADLFGADAPEAFPGGLPLDLGALERLAIGEALRRVHGNRTQAARLLNIGLRTLRNKLRAWREAGEAAPASARTQAAATAGPGAEQTAAILARSWARRSHEDRP